MISLEKLKTLTPLQKLPNNVEDLRKLIVAKGFEKLPKVQSIVQSGHTDQHVLQKIFSLKKSLTLSFCLFQPQTDLLS